MAEQTVEAFMSRDVVCVEPSCSIDQVLQQITARRISCVVVCEKECPVGIITERDVAQLAADQIDGGKRLQHTARELMTSPAVTVNASESVDSAIELTQFGKFRHLVVVDSADCLVGLVTQTDLLLAKTQQSD